MAPGYQDARKVARMAGRRADSSVIKKGFSKNRQEDTQEFFRFAVDALQNQALFGTPKWVFSSLSLTLQFIELQCQNVV